METIQLKRLQSIPPIETPEAETDMDPDASDEEVTCNPDHLPRRILMTKLLMTPLSKRNMNHHGPPKKTETEIYL